jgi:drug/metabolite transporter (DMT)-like permease
MKQTAHSLDAGAAAIMVVLCLSWGLNQVAIKAVAADVPPMMQAGLRSAGALALVVLWMRCRGLALFACDGTLKAGLAAGLLFGGEFVLVYGGMQFTTASRSALFLYTAPFFVALGSRWLLPGERLRPVQWAGLLLSFVGVALAMGAPRTAADLRTLSGDAMLIGAGAMWAATTLVIKTSRLATVAPEKTLAWQLAGSLPVFVIATLGFGESWPGWPGPRAFALIAYQTVWVVGITYCVWFALVQRYAASRLSAFSFLTPLFGVVAGHFLLGEPLTAGFLAAVALVVAGLVLVNRPR